MATLGAYDLHHGVEGASYPVALVATFGAPRSLGASSWFTSSSPVHYDVPSLRVTHYRDVVPRFPPRSTGFFHPTPLYHHAPREVYLQRSCCSSRACDGSGEDSACNGGNNYLWAVLNGGIGDHFKERYDSALGGS